MRKHFPCEKGCTVELGPDVPAYVADANQTLHKYCLITQARSGGGRGGTGQCVARRQSGQNLPLFAELGEHCSPSGLMVSVASASNPPSISVRCALRPSHLQKASTCAAKHAATARLCACIPRGSPAEGGTARHRRHVLAAAGSNTGLSGGDAAQTLQQEEQQQQGVAAATARSESSGAASLEVG